MIDRDYLHSVIEYQSHTGNFVWLKPRPKVKVGTIAGSTNPVDGYRYITIDQQQYSQHRLIWFYVTGEWPPEEIDHKNMIRHDNRWENLRLATRTQNLGNGKARVNLKGTTRMRSGRWQAQIAFNKKKIHIGAFDTQLEAHEAYVAKAKELFGEFARVA